MQVLDPTNPENFDLLYAAFLSGSMSRAEWETYLDETPGLSEWLDEMEAMMELTRGGR